MMVLSENKFLIRNKDQEHALALGNFRLYQFLERNLTPDDKREGGY